MNETYFAFYGSLMSGLEEPRQPDREALLEFVDECIIPGALYRAITDQGPQNYPGLALDIGDKHCVRGELYVAVDRRALKIYDDWEEYRPEEPHFSHYQRRLLRLIEPEIDAWVYQGLHKERGWIEDKSDWRKALLE